MSYWVLAANLKLPNQRVVCAAAIIKATVFLLLACLRLSLLFLNSINRLVEVKHCGGGREGTHTLTHLKESRANTHTRTLSNVHTDIPSHGHKHANKFCNADTRTQTQHSPGWTGEGLPICALSEMINLFSQPFRPEHTKPV